MKKITAVFLAAAIIFALCSCAVKNSEERKALEKIMADSGFGGVISVWDDGETLCENAFGPSNTEAAAENRTDSLFCVGSISKQFTAAAVMLLRERGLLSVDDRLGKYFPDCPYGDRVTLHQMLCMRSGIAEFYDVTVDRYNIIETPAGTLRQTVTNSGSVSENREKLQKWLFEQPLRYEPGSCYAYTNSNYFLLARIVELVSGKAYEDFVCENIFQPLEMKSSGFIDRMYGDPRISKGSHEVKTVYVGITMGLGDIITCSADMGRWLNALCDGGMISDESFKMMTENYSGKEENPYGYGLQPDGKGGCSHTGVFASFYAFTYINPGESCCLFAVTNEQGRLTEDISAISARVLKNVMPSIFATHY